jgi:hypothetical protein
LEACGAAFDDGTACHLDLIQWATDPIWGKRHPKSVRKQLLVEDAPFLAEQLKNERLRLLLVNGMSVIRQRRRTLAPQLEELKPITGYAHVNTRLFAGTAFDRIRVIGWSTNLQSSFGVTNELREELANRVADWANDEATWRPGSPGSRTGRRGGSAAGCGGPLDARPARELGFSGAGIPGVPIPLR